MKTKIFSVFDSKAKAWLPPFFVTNDQVALRIFTDCANSDQHQFGANPSDYTLFRIGEFDDEDAKIEPIPPESLACAIILVKPPARTNSHDTQIRDESPIQPGS